MKNIFIIPLITLLLSGCFKDKAEVAIENCADDKIKFISTSNNFLTNELKNDKRYVILEKEYQTSQQKHLEAITKFEKFVKENFRNSDYLIRYYKPYLYYGNLHGEEARYFLELPTSLFYINEDGTKSEKFVIRLDLKNFSQNLLDTNLQEITASRELSKYKRDRFKKWSIKRKFLNDKYAKYYKKCELDYNRTPKTFIATWLEN